MRFTGTHIPGAHTIVVPNPAPIVLPERKIIAATEAAAWHEKRGGAAVSQDENGGGGDTHPLLTDLAAGWELTAGPQQTLDSSGVVASGPWDLENTGAEIYGVDGLTTDSPDGAGPFVEDVTGASLDVPLPSTSWLLMARMKVVAGGVQFTGSGAIANPYSLAIGTGAVTGCRAIAAIQGDGTISLVIYSPDMPEGTFYNCFAWYNSSDGTLNLQVGTGSPVSQSVSGSLGPSWHHVIADLFLFPGVDQGSFISLCRLWIGANAATIAENYLPALDASGLGMTDAALAAYTG